MKFVIVNALKFIRARNFLVFGTREEMIRFYGQIERKSSALISVIFLLRGSFSSTAIFTKEWPPDSNSASLKPKNSTSMMIFYQFCNISIPSPLHTSLPH